MPLTVLWVFQLVKNAHVLHVTNLATAVSTAIGLIFLLSRRRAVVVDRSIAAWTAAVVGTVSAMFLYPGGIPVAPYWITGSLAVTGVLVTTAGLLSLGRSFAVVPSNRGIVSSGMYRCVRHPLYAGYLLTHIGFCLANPTPANLLIACAVQTIQLFRIFYEERLLTHDRAYQDYLTRVRWRLVPGVF